MKCHLEKFHEIAGLVLFILGAGGCTPSLRMYVWHPAPVSVPLEVETLAIVHRDLPPSAMLDTLMKKYILTSMVVGLLEGGISEATHATLSSILDYALLEQLTQDFLQSLDAELYAWGRFVSAGPPIISFWKGSLDTARLLTGPIPSPLPEDALQKVYGSFPGAEGVLVVELFFLSGTTQFPGVIASLRLYDLRTGEILHEATVREGTIRKVEYSTLLETTEKLARRCARQLTPYQVPERFWFARSPAPLRTGWNYLRVLRIDEAFASWQEVARDPSISPKARARAAYNLALLHAIYCEMDSAEYWREQISVEFLPASRILALDQYIQQRASQCPALIQQLTPVIRKSSP